MKQPRLLACALLLLCAPSPVRPQTPRNFDAVVYSGTAGGVMTAVSAAREGLNVEPGKHLGGMVTGGLSRTDFGKKEVIGGIALEFYQRADRKYGREIEWLPEPRVAEAILHEMIGEAQTITVFLNHRLREKGGVRKQGTRIIEIRLANGAAFTGRMFVDASYEGICWRRPASISSEAEKRRRSTTNRSPVCVRKIAIINSISPSRPTTNDGGGCLKFKRNRAARSVRATARYRLRDNEVQNPASCRAAKDAGSVPNVLLPALLSGACAVFSSVRKGFFPRATAAVKPQGCCANQPAVLRRMIGTYYTTEGNFRSTLILNKGPNQIGVTPILHGKNGQEKGSEGNSIPPDVTAGHVG